MPRASIATLLSLVMCTSTFAGCEATLKDGIATCGADDDRPTGFECRAEAGDDTRYCFSQRAQVAKVSDVGGQGDSGSSAGRDAESSGATGGGAGRGGSSGSLATDAGDSGTGRNGGSGDSGGKSPRCEPGVFDQSLFAQACFQSSLGYRQAVGIEAAAWGWAGPAGMDAQMDVAMSAPSSKPTRSERPSSRWPQTWSRTDRTPRSARRRSGLTPPQAHSSP